MTTEQKIHFIADYYGYEPQSRQLIEEMAELTVALNKAWRKTFDTVDKIPNMDDEERIEEETEADAGGRDPSAEEAGHG